MRKEIKVADRTVEAMQGTERAVAVDKLVSLRRELVALVKEAEAAEAAARESALAEAQALAGNGGAVVVPVVTSFGSKILFVTGSITPSSSGTKVGAKGQATGPPPSITVIDLPNLTLDLLDRLLRGKREDAKPGGWLGSYPASDLPLLERRRREREWPSTLDMLLPELWPLFAGKLHAALRRLGIPSGARVIWLPTGALGIFPLAAAQNPTTKRRLSDEYEIVYAPSLTALTGAQARVAKVTRASLAAVINPTGDLRSAELEGVAVAARFSPGERTVLTRKDATADAVLAALTDKTHWHFATHGTFSWSDVRQSALMMHGHVQLDIGRLLDAGRFGGPRLVVLSACETGLYDIDRNPDEFVGLPSAFVALGAAGVISTLWPVDDHASALLIAKFYELHIGSARLPPPTALHRAQAWLRTANQADIRAYARAAGVQGKRSRPSIEMGIGHRRLRLGTASEAVPPTAKTATRSPAIPYAHPDFWAAFVYTGL